MNLWLANLLAYWLQVAVISLAAALVARTFRLRSPQSALACRQGLLGVFLLLPLFEPWSAEPAGITGISIAAAAAARVPTDGRGPMPVLAPLAAVLIAGMAARLVWLAMGYSRLYRWRQEVCRLDAHHAVIAPFRAAAGRPLEICLSTEIAAPVTFGLWRPTVLLPMRWLDLEPQLQRDCLPRMPARPPQGLGFPRGRGNHSRVAVVSSSRLVADRGNPAGARAGD